MSNHLPFTEWDSLPLESYKLILAELKERFESEISEVVSVTDKVTKYTIGFLTFLFATSVYVLAKYSINEMTWVFFILSAANAGYGVWIVSAREGFSSGLVADNILTDDFDSTDFTALEKERLSYLNAIKAYGIKIDGIKDDNKKRAGKYNIFLIATMALVISIAANTLITIYYCHTTA